MSSIPKIDNRLPKQLPDPVKLVLIAMFTGYQAVIVLSEFSNGQSGSCVLKVRPILANGAELPSVVKIDEVAAIEQEWQAYQTCIRNRLPSIAAIQGEPVFPPRNPLGGLRYGLAGEGVFDVVSLADYCEQASPEQIERALRRLFQAMAALWEQKDVQAELYMQTAYDSFVPVNLVIELVTTPTEREPKWLHPTTARQETWQVGDVLKLAGFQPVEIVPAKNRVLFNSPDSDQAFRFYLTGVADVTSYNIGRVIERPNSGIIKETRHTLLTQQVRELLQETELTVPTLILDDGIELPNPLVIYPMVLSRSFDAHVACIHGDLHLQNVLVEPGNGNSYLIDFGKSRQDHVLRDLLHLEMSVVTGLLPHYLDKEEFAPSQLVDFYTRLHCAIQHPEKIIAPGNLQRPFFILQQVRKGAQRYLFKDWKEYYDALGLYLLSALKFDNLDSFAKQVAFWGSAIAFQLSQNSPDCTTFIEAEKQSLDVKTPLKEALERRQLALFIGADFPQALTGLSSRADLAQALAQRYGLPAGLTLAQAAQRVSRAGNRYHFTSFLLEALNSVGKAPAAMHQRLAALVNKYHLKTIITTAYDDLLEQALRQFNVSFHTVINNSDIRFMQPDQLTLIKLYGTTNRPDSLVITEQDHTLLLRDQNRDEVLNEVRRTLAQNSIYFLGYNLADPDFASIRDHVATSRFARTAYALWPGLDVIEVQMWRDRGLEILDTDPLHLVEDLSAPS